MSTQNKGHCEVTRGDPKKIPERHKEAEADDEMMQKETRQEFRDARIHDYCAAFLWSLLNARCSWCEESVRHHKATSPPRGLDMYWDVTRAATDRSGRSRDM